MRTSCADQEEEGEGVEEVGHGGRGGGCWNARFVCGMGSRLPLSLGLKMLRRATSPQLQRIRMRRILISAEDSGGGGSERVRNAQRRRLGTIRHQFRHKPRFPLPAKFRPRRPPLKPPDPPATPPPRQDQEVPQSCPSSTTTSAPTSCGPALVRTSPPNPPTWNRARD